MGKRILDIRPTLKYILHSTSNIFLKINNSDLDWVIITTDSHKVMVVIPQEGDYFAKNFERVRDLENKFQEKEYILKGWSLLTKTRAERFCYH